MLSSSFLCLLPTTKSFELPLQLKVVGHDAATPNLQGETEVYILVRRNENRPVFSRTSYQANINESYPQGAAIVQVEATDQENTVSVVCNFYITQSNVMG